MPESTLSMINPLRAFLDARGIRYIWAAERLGITPSHLTRLMDSERPLTAVMADRLAALFDVPASTFLPESREEGE